MKKLIFYIILSLLVVSCKTTKTSCDAYSELKVQEDTDKQEIMRSQRALAIYIQSLSEEEKNEWIKGTFTEKEKNEFIKSIKKN